MRIVYVLTVIALGIAFMIRKKSKEKLNFFKWLIIFIVSLLGYNVFLGMILGLLNITSYLWLLSLINLAVSGLLGYKAIKKKEYQEYYIRKFDIASIAIIFLIFGVMLVKDLYIHKGDVSHMAVDSAIHYRAAKHYAENLKIFINVKDKTFFNFNVMQTGAYINDGIFMNVVHGITKLDYAYIYQVFESVILLLSGLAFYASFADKINTKKGLVGSLVAWGLYLYGYPYNSWFYGFSYLSVGIMFVAMLIPVLEALYEGVDKKEVITLIVLLGTGLIFSYCLFVPAVFASICIYCFLKDLSNKKEKKIFKYFGKTTVIVTAALVVVTIAGIGYLFIPTFFIEGQTDLVSALKIDGAIYNERYKNFIPYIPFAILYCVEIVKKIKSKELKYMDVFAVIMMGYFALLNIGLRAGYVSLYYMFKTYFIVWMVIFAVVVDLINKYVDEKIFRVDAIILFLLFVLLAYKKVSSENIFRIYLILTLLLFTVIPEIIKKVNLKKIKFIPKKYKKIEIKRICITGSAYVCIWAVFVCGWVWIKAGHIIGEEEKHSQINYVGMYYMENCQQRKQVDLTQNFNKNELQLASFARENIDDMTADNTCLMTSGYYTRIWATAVTEINSDKMKYEEVTQDTHNYTLKEALANKKYKYIIKLVSKDQAEMEAYNKMLEEVKEKRTVNILLENENGFVAEIKR